MNKNSGFTLVEIIAVISILAIIFAIAVPSYYLIMSHVKQSSYENKVKYIETSAARYGEDTSNTFVFVDTLIKEGYLEADDEEGLIYDPRDNSILNCYLVSIYYEDTQIYTTLTTEQGFLEDEKTCDFDRINDQNSILDFKAYEVTNESGSAWKNTPLENNKWTRSNVILIVNISDELKKYVSKITFSGAGIKEEREVHNDFDMKNKYYINVSQLFSATMNVIVELNQSNDNEIKNNVYTASAKVRVDRQSPIIYKNEIKVEQNDKWTKEKKNVTILMSDGNGSGIKSVAVSKEKDCTKAVYEDTELEVYTNSYPAGEYYVCAKDKVDNLSENESTVQFRVENIDNEGPEIIAIPSDKWGYTNEIGYTFIDEKSGINGYQLTEEDKQPENWQRIDNTKNISGTINNIEKNGIYYLWVMDAVENISKKEVEIKYVDRDGPIISSLLSSKEWSSHNSVIAQVRDQQSGLVASAITEDEKEPTNWDQLENTTITKTITYSKTKNATYYFWAKDLVGNISHGEIVVDHIDTVAPDISLTTDTAWSNVSNTVTAKVRDHESGLVKYAWSLSNTVPNNWITIQSTTTQMTYTNRYYENQIIYFWAQDQVGNTSKQSISVNRIDKVGPVITPSYNKNWSKGGKTINVSVTDALSGVKNKFYKTSSNSSYSALGNSFYTTSNDNWIKATDYANNTTTKYVTSYIDNTAPYTPYMDIEESLKIMKYFGGGSSVSGVDPVPWNEKIECSSNNSESMSPNYCSVVVNNCVYGVNHDISACLISPPHNSNYVLMLSDRGSGVRYYRRRLLKNGVVIYDWDTRDLANDRGFTKYPSDNVFRPFQFEYQACDEMMNCSASLYVTETDWQY